MPMREDFWRVPRLWPDRTVYIIGGGPSLRSVNVEELRGERVIAVNNAYKLGNWIDVLYYGDCRWLAWHKDQVRAFAGLKITSCDQHDSNLGRALNIKVVRKRNSPIGIQRDPGMLGWNRSSGACAINLAVHLGARRIVLLGYDMRKIDGASNWHADHPNAEAHDPYAKFLEPFPAIARDLAALGIDCINATPGSALTVFPIVHPEFVMPPVDWGLVGMNAVQMEAAAC